VNLEIDYGHCVGHGVCFMQAAALFDCDDEGRGVVLVPEVPDSLSGTANFAVAGCPGRAVILRGSIH
jgi:ferredoxin